MKITYDRPNGEGALTVEISGEEVAALVSQVPAGVLPSVIGLARRFTAVSADGGTNNERATSESAPPQRLLEGGLTGNTE
jgi:hypothetical protein